MNNNTKKTNAQKLKNKKRKFGDLLDKNQEDNKNIKNKKKIKKIKTHCLKKFLIIK